MKKFNDFLNEGNNHLTKEFVKPFFDNSPYNIIIYRTEDQKDFENLKEVLKKFPFLNYNINGLFDHFLRPKDYFISLKTMGIFKQFSILGASHQYYESGRLFRDEPDIKVYPQIIRDPNALERMISGSIRPTYAPKKISREI